MVTVDDSKLEDLSSRYQQPILRVTEKSARSASLLILLSILPALIAFPFRTIDDENASFGLQCLGNTDATWNSPLAVWLTSAVTGKLRVLHFEGMILISAMGTAIFLIVTFHLVKLLAGHRVAFWSLVFLVTHPLVVRMAVRPAPLAIGLACSVSSLLMYWRHLRQSRKLLSYNVLFSGIAFGGVLLSCGLLSGLHLSLIVSLSFLVNRKTEDKTSSMTVARVSLRTAGVLVVTAFAVSGWWIMKTAIGQGSSFWGDWMSGRFGIDTEEGFQAASIHETSSLNSVWTEFFVLSGVMTGPFLVGVGYLFYRTFIRKRKTDVAKNEVAFLFVWFVLAMGCWILSQAVPLTRTWVFSTSFVALAVPLTIFAGFCITEITDRNLGLGWVVAVWEIGLLIAIAFPFDDFELAFSQIEPFFYWSPVIVVAIVLISYCVVWFCRHRFRLAKILTVSAILSFPLYNLSKSWERMRTPNEDSKTLHDFLTALTKLSDIETILVSSSDAVPLPLKYSLRSRWPDAEWITENRSQTANSENRSRTLLVRWKTIETKDGNGLRSLGGFRPVTDPVLYRKRELRAYFSGQEEGEK